MKARCPNPLHESRLSRVLALFANLSMPTLGPPIARSGARFAAKHLAPFVQLPMRSKCAEF